MAAVALALELEEDDSPPQGEPRGRTLVPRRRRPGRRQKIRIKHKCYPGWHGPEGRQFYSTVLTRCTIHDTVMLELGEWGRVYPEPVCYDCLGEIPHRRGCPMGDASVIAAWLGGMTCVCPDRLRPLGLKIQKIPVAKRRAAPSLWAVGPA